MRRLPLIDLPLDAAGLLAELERHGGRVADSDHQARAVPAPTVAEDATELERVRAWQHAERTHQGRFCGVAIRALRLEGIAWEASYGDLVASVLRWARVMLRELVAREKELDQALADLARARAERATTEAQHAQALAFERAEAELLDQRRTAAEDRARAAEQAVAAQREELAALRQRLAVTDARLEGSDGRARAAEAALVVSVDTLALLKAALRVPLDNQYSFPHRIGG